VRPVFITADNYHQELGEVIRMRHIVVRQHKLLALDALLRARPEAGKSTVSLELSAWESEDDSRAFPQVSERVMAHLPWLCVLKISLYPSLQPSFVRFISSGCFENLRNLAIVLNTDIDACITEMRNLTKLQRLDLTIDLSDTAGSLDHLPPLSLNDVHYLRLRSFSKWPHYFMSSDHLILSWLATCRFRHECALVLTDAVPRSPKEWSSLGVFVDLHACDSITTYFDEPEIRQLCDPCLFRKARKVDFGTDYAPPAELFTVQRLPREVWFAARPENPDSVQDALDIIRSLCNSRRTHELTLHIRIRPEDEISCIKDEQAYSAASLKFIEHIDGQAEELGRHGVHIVYEDGEFDDQPDIWEWIMPYTQ
jgi:hypothetical protein